ncbi:MAG: FliH/SctL family protein [Rhizomicrobium sp.]
MVDVVKTMKKFTFDTEFRGTKDVFEDTARARQRKSLTQDEINQMCAAARQEGVTSGEVRAAEKTAAAVEVLGRNVRDLLGKYHSEIEHVRQEAVHCALVVARKLARGALESCPEAEVEEALRAAICEAVGEPKLVLRASPPVVEILSERLDEIAQSAGYSGQLVASADPALSGPDCRIEWPGGGLEHNLETVEAAIADIIERRFARKQAGG